MEKLTEEQRKQLYAWIGMEQIHGMWVVPRVLLDVLAEGGDAVA